MHDCNRHRKDGYKDVTWADRIPAQVIDEFGRRRTVDYNRDINMVNKRFPSLAEARDQYLRQSQRMQESLEQSQHTGLGPFNIEHDGSGGSYEHTFDEKVKLRSMSRDLDDFSKVQTPGRKLSMLGEQPYVDPDSDIINLTQKQKALLYAQGDSPKNRAVAFVKRQIEATKKDFMKLNPVNASNSMTH